MITIMLPVYNSEKTIAACIDSILRQTFTDFELLIADDGSTDDTLKIIEGYQDSRIRILRLKHDFIHTLNTLLDEAKGKYLARMDADDVMLPVRLQVEFDYLEQHPDVDVVGGCMGSFDWQNKKIKEADRVLLLNMLETCCICNSTVLMRQTVLQKYQIRYEQAYIYAEDYRFWVELLKKGAVIRNLSQVVMGKHLTIEEQITYKYKKEQEKVSEDVRDDIVKWTKAREDEVKRDFTVLPESGNKLTVVIAFLDECEEVGRTVRSVRETVGDQVDVIVINDHSKNDYDYDADLKGLNVHYYFNKFRIGAAASKEKGVQISSTPYFILLDAHMRFYDKNWLNRLVEELHQNSNRLLCCQTLVLVKRKNGKIIRKKGGKTFGAYFLFNRKDYMPQIRWNPHCQTKYLTNNQISGVLGASYCTSKNYWNKIYGLQGLIHYGQEEAYISFKAWLEGGGCYLVPDVVIGHIYREKFPYPVFSSMMIYNTVLIDELLFPLPLRSMALAIARQKNIREYRRIEAMLFRNKEENNELKHFYHEFAGHDFKYILQINSLLIPQEEKVTIKLGQKIDEIMQFLSELSLNENHIGLVDGLMGYVLLFCKYADYSGIKKYEEKASDLFLHVLRNLNNDLPVSLQSGVPGIGWGILYLQTNGLLNDQMEEELLNIDQMVMERNLTRTIDTSMRTGVGGVLAYVALRLANKVHHGFTKDYLLEVKDVSSKMLQQEDVEYRTWAYAFQIQEIIHSDPDEEMLPLRVEDLFDLPKSAPENLNLSPLGLRGLSGYVLNMMDKLSQTTFKNIKDEKK